MARQDHAGESLLTPRAARGKKCAAMEGLIQEGSGTIEGGFEAAVLDAALIGAAQRVQHYDIAAYGATHEFANIQGKMEHASLLKETLAEERETDDKLTELAEEINDQANEADSAENQDEATRERSMSKNKA